MRRPSEPLPTQERSVDVVLIDNGDRFELSSDDKKRISHIFTNSKLGKVDTDGVRKTRLVLSSHGALQSLLVGWYSDDFLISSFHSVGDSKKIFYSPTGDLNLIRGHPVRAIHECEKGCLDLSFPKVTTLLDRIFFRASGRLVRVWEDRGIPTFYYLNYGMYTPLDFTHCRDMDLIVFFLERYLNPPDRLPTLDSWLRGRKTDPVRKEDYHKILTEMANERLSKQIVGIKKKICLGEERISEMNRRVREARIIARAHRANVINLKKQLETVEKAPKFDVPTIRKVIKATPEIIDISLKPGRSLHGDGDYPLPRCMGGAKDANSGYEVIIKTRPIPIEYRGMVIELGGFKISFDYDTSSNSVIMESIRFKNLKPLKDGGGDNIIHPHIYPDGRMCFGQEEENVGEMCYEGDVLKLARWFIAALKTYNSGSPVTSIEVFARAVGISVIDEEDEELNED